MLGTFCYRRIAPLVLAWFSTDLLTEAWVVVKPTEDGVVTAIECYDQHGELMVQFFGLRKPGIPELEGWRELVKAFG